MPTKTYIVTFVFISGEYQQRFHKIFKAGDTQTLDGDINKYLINYYPDATQDNSRKDLYFYYGRQIAVKLEDYKEVTEMGQIIEMLLA